MLLRALATLLVCQCIGEIARLALGLPVPGPVLGMMLLLVALRLRPGQLETLRPTATEFLRHLSLLFVPAGVGVMLHGARLASEGWAIAVALVVSTAVAIVVTALTMQWVQSRLRPRR